MNRLTSLLILLGTFAAILTAAEPERMNLLFVLTDDQRDDSFSGMGHPWVDTPNVDALLKRSTRFSNAYIAEPICCPSRASFLLGCHERVHRIGFSSPQRLTRKQWTGSYPALLRDAGYHTGLVGKWHIKLEKGLNHADLFDVFDGHEGHGPFLFSQNTGKSLDLRPVPEGDRPITTNKKKTEDALKFMDGVPEDKPFCLSICYATPHSSKFRVMWKEWDKPAFNNPSLSDHPVYGHKGPYRDLGITTPLSGEKPNPYEHIPKSILDQDGGRNKTYNFCYEEAMCLELHLRYYQMVTEIDLMIGELVAGLEKRGLTEKTLIVFGSDHGLMMGEHGMGGKGLLYDLAVKFPCFIFDPKADPATRGTERSEIISSLDITSTLLDYAGVKTLPHMVGQSLKPFLRSPERPAGWRDGLVLESLYIGRQNPIQDGYVTEAGQKYIRYYQTKGKRYAEVLKTVGKDPEFEQLFLLGEDPSESKNLIDDPEQAEAASKLREACEKGMVDMMQQRKAYAARYFD